MKPRALCAFGTLVVVLLAAAPAFALSTDERARIGDRLALVNALLNSTAAVLLIAGGLFIRRRNSHLHRRSMLSALIVSAMFLTSYLTRVTIAGIHPYTGGGLGRTVYLVVLTSHMLLAAVTPPLALTALYFALRERFAQHRAIVRYAYPIWLYVSVTGVVVYLMLYL